MTTFGTKVHIPAEMTLLKFFLICLNVSGPNNLTPVLLGGSGGVKHSGNQKTFVCVYTIYSRAANVHEIICS